MKLPNYRTLAGQRFPIGSLGKSDVRLRIENTTVEECKEYAVSLEVAGFSLAQAREIPVGNGERYGRKRNLFYAYSSGATYVFLFWNCALHTTFITVEEGVALPKDAPSAERKRSPIIAQPYLEKGGTCFISRNTDGSFVIVDGGQGGEADTQRIYEFLKEHCDGATPTIALWVFTHSHADHIGLATEFFARYQSLVEIRAVAYQFPDCDKVNVAMESVLEMKKSVERFERSFAENYPTALVYPLHTGQNFSFGGMEMDVLYSLDDTYPSTYLSFNDFSAALRLRFENGKSVILLGDCMHEACRKIAYTYGEYLKSDVLQVAHHGLIGGDQGLYEKIDPDICLWPVSEDVFLGKVEHQRYAWCLGEGGCDYNAYLRDDSVRKRVHYCNNRTVCISVEA